jgi:hydroxymethylpyrimidine pyrophosphatase-like HAD family hydrolase
LAVDVDGTLLNSRHEVPAAHREALHRAHQAGMKVALCTGRSLTETRPVMEAVSLDMDFAVLGFGAIVTDVRAGKTIHRMPVGAALVSELVSFLGGAGYPVLMLCDVTTDGTDYLLLGGSRHARMYERWLAASPCRTEQIESWPVSGRTPVRVGVIGPRGELEDLRAEADTRFPAGAYKVNVIHAPNYGLDVIEFFHPEVNKWNALSRLCGLYEIDPQQVAAVGDDVNDLEMIRCAGLGIAMGNAAASVKSAAARTVAGHDEAGLRAAVDLILAGGGAKEGPLSQR